jgi:hypothetical protein
MNKRTLEEKLAPETIFPHHLNTTLNYSPEVIIRESIGNHNRVHWYQTHQNLRKRGKRGCSPVMYTYVSKCKNNKIK